MSSGFLFSISGNAAEQYPAEMLYGLLEFSQGEVIEIPRRYPFQEDWGTPSSIRILEMNEHCPLSFVLQIVWLSVMEQGLYLYNKEVQHDSLYNNKHKVLNKYYDSIVVGMAPYGYVSVWLYGLPKSIILSWGKGEEIKGEIKNRLLLNQTLFPNKDKEEDALSRRIKISETPNGLPPRDLFDNYMKQFTYRYMPLFEHWDEDEEKWQPFTEEEQEAKPELDYIEEALYDGTHDKLHDGGLLNYHEAGKPKKLAVKWHIKKSEYTAYFWFEDEAIRAIYDKFYGIHPETKTDFIIHIDPIKKKYQLSLFRYGLQEPKIISEDAYQLIVFKNKFEHFRSKNYDQPRGAWIW